MSETRPLPAPAGAFSHWHAVDRAYLVTSGQVGVDPATGQPQPTLVEQVDQAIDNLKLVLADAGASLSDVIKTTCFLADITEFATFDAAYGARFAEPYPSRSTIGVTLVGGLLFEIEAVALLPDAERTVTSDREGA